MKLEIAVLSRSGGRPSNEDACGYWTSDDACCWVLSDGVGGHWGGDVASKKVVSTILHDFAVAPTVAPDVLGGLILRANDALLQEQATQLELRDMRATVVVLAMDCRRELAMWGHTGDSRIYGFRGCRVRFQSRDHSVMQSMLDAGFGDVAMLRKHPQRNILFAALGSADGLRPSVSGAPEPVLEGDVFLLCSDGLWEYVEEAVMEQLLAVSPSAQAWLAALEGELLARVPDDHDNYSAIAIWAGNPGETTLIVSNP